VRPIDNPPKVWQIIVSIIGLIGVGTIVTGLIELGRLQNRVEVLETKMTDVESGPRGDSCIAIVNKLADAAARNDKRAEASLEKSR